MNLITFPGVFQPHSDTWMLAEVLRREPMPSGAAVLDLGTGSGALVVTGALLGAQVTAVDVSRRALWSARLNARRHGVGVRGRCGNLFDALGGARFHVIVSNPPYVPSRTDHLPRRGAQRAWDAGEDLDVIRAVSQGDHVRRHPERCAIQAQWRGPTVVVASP